MIRKNKLLVLSLVLVLGLICSTVSFADSSDFAGGSGTADDPWQIANVEQLNNVRDYLGDKHDDKHFVLTADIDLGPPGIGLDPINWEPIGQGGYWDRDDLFWGHFDGAGYTISNLYIDREEEEYVGLFGATYGAYIENIYLENVDVTGERFVGSLVGRASITSIYHSHACGDVSGYRQVGGLVGLSYLAIPLAFSSANATVTGNFEVGGLVGTSAGDGFVEYSYATGSVTGVATVGGLVGLNSWDNRIQDSFATGSVTGDNRVGGLLGRSLKRSSVEHSYSIGAVNGGTNTGGLIGKLDVDGEVEVENCYYNQETSGQSDDVGKGEPRTTAEMTAPYDETTTYIDWDFADTWNIQAGINKGYPYHTDSSIVGTDFEEGSGTDDDPWQIANADQLNNVRYYLGFDNRDRHFVLVADIDLSDYGTGYDDGKGWEPIGHQEYGSFFRGNFDGAGHTITNLYIAREDEHYIGLFGIVVVGNVTDVILHDVDVTGRMVVGGLVGEATVSHVHDSHVSGKVEGTDTVGGLVGKFANAGLRDCSSSADVTGDDKVGGLVGESIDYASIGRSYATGEVEGINQVGGLVGYQNNSFINDSYANGNVSGNDCVGGLVGHALRSSTSESYAIGAVSGSSDVGGLIGKFDDPNSREVRNSYYNQQTSGQSDTGKGESRTTGQMTYPHAGNTYIDWDFENTWNIMKGVNNDYPFLIEEVDEEDDEIEVTVTIDPNQSKVYGDPDPAFTYTSSDPDATFTGELSREAGEDVGSYAINQGTLTGTGDYVITEFISADFVITPAEPTVIWPTGTMTYGEALADADLTGGSALFDGEDVAGAFLFDDPDHEPEVGDDQDFAATFVPDSDNFSAVSGTIVVDVDQKELAIGCSFTAEDKIYDGTTDATIDDNQLELDGVVGDDDVELIDVVIQFARADAGSDIQVNITSADLDGNDAGNYTLSLEGAPSTTANITAKKLTIVGSFTAEDKVYDGTAEAIIEDDQLGLDGVVDNDDVVLVDVVAEFAEENVGTWTVSITDADLNGNDAGNYTVSLEGAPTTTAEITAKELTITDAVAEDKVYDGTTDATVDFSDAELVGVVGSEDVDFDTSVYEAEFADPDVGENKEVTVSGIVLTGDDKDNYTLTQPVLSAEITLRPITITAASAMKVYDGTELTDDGYEIIDGSLAPAQTLDSVTVTGSQTEVGSSPNVPSDAVITDDAQVVVTANYNITYEDGTLKVLPQGALTTSNFNYFDMDEEDERQQFRLIFTPDYQAASDGSVYRLAASNPGQFRYNAFFDATDLDEMTLTISYPFVTQGAMPVHVYDAGDATYDFDNGFGFTPGDAVDSQDDQIALDNYTPEALGSTTEITVDVSGIDGLSIVTIHLDYGPKRTTGWAQKQVMDEDKNPIAYEYDAETGGALKDGLEIINNQDYYFFHMLNGDTFGEVTGYSINEFKRNTGIGGLVVPNGIDPLEAVEVQIYQNTAATGRPGSLSTPELRATVYTDEDGWYLWAYQWRGRPTSFTVIMSYDGSEIYRKENIELSAMGYYSIDFIGDVD